QKYLDYASEYLLKNGYTIPIANINHVIIPQFLSSSEVDLEMALEGIQRKSDLLFNLKKLENFSENIHVFINEEETFWINFIAFESDGNSFKTTETIKDVSKFQFEKLLAIFFEINKS